MKLLPRFSKWDIAAFIFLALVLLPVYFYKIYTIPWQINTDEITIMMAAKHLLTDPEASLWGLSYYFGFPSFIFIVFGWLSTLLGGINLENFRLVHAAFGAGSALLFYILCRQFFTPFKSLMFAVLLGSNHALFAISRMAMRDNTGLFLELLALIFLVRGLKHKSLFQTFIGGLVTGLAFYTYFPARITLVIWLGVLFVLAIIYHTKKDFKELFRQAVVYVAGFIVVAAPVLVATLNQPPEALNYQKQQFLFYPEGQKLQQHWMGAETTKEGWQINIKQGLTMFNRQLHDQGFIYPNYGHGFVDKLTGILLWVGLFVVLTRFVKRRHNLFDLLAVLGFMVLYVLFAFLITKAPNYTRLLVMLPFVVYLAGEGLWWIGDLISRMVLGARFAHLRHAVRAVAASVFVGVIVYSNVAIFKDFVKVSSERGNDVGSTARYVEARKDIFGHKWVLAADKLHMYYSWGESWQWKDWLGFFAGKNQTVTVLAPSDLLSKPFARGTTVLLNSYLWNANEYQFGQHNPSYTIHNITPDGRLLAIEIE